MAEDWMTCCRPEGKICFRARMGFLFRLFWTE
jgi:hypothetical protein